MTQQTFPISPSVLYMTFIFISLFDLYSHPPQTSDFGQ